MGQTTKKIYSVEKITLLVLVVVATFVHSQTLNRHSTENVF